MSVPFDSRMGFQGFAMSLKRGEGGKGGKGPKGSKRCKWQKNWQPAFCFLCPLRPFDYYRPLRPLLHEDLEETLITFLSLYGRHNI